MYASTRSYQSNSDINFVLVTLQKFLACGKGTHRKKLQGSNLVGHATAIKLKFILLLHNIILIQNTKNLVNPYSAKEKVTHTAKWDIFGPHHLR